MGLITINDKTALEDLAGERTGAERDFYIASYLVNNGLLSSYKLEVAESNQKGLRDTNLLVRSRTMVKMVNHQADVIREKISRNVQLSNIILERCIRVRKKSESSEHLALGYLTGLKEVGK